MILAAKCVLLTSSEHVLSDFTGENFEVQATCSLIPSDYLLELVVEGYLDS